MKQLLSLLIAASTVVGATQASHAATYEYDDIGRLTKATLDDGTVIDYTYDAVGNRTSKVVLDGAGPNDLPDVSGMPGTILIPLDGKFYVIPIP